MCFASIYCLYVFIDVQEKLAQLTAELTGKKAILSTAVEVVKDMSERIAANSEKKDGLCIRLVFGQSNEDGLDYITYLPTYRLDSN